MKKTLTVALLFFASSTLLFAQDAATNFKPEKGANNFELNFVPLNGKPIQMTYIRYRKFLSEKAALRIGIGLSLNTTKGDSVFASNVTANATVKSEYKTTKMGWAIKPGIEFHMKGTDRLSPYMGFELDIAGQSTKDVNPQGVDAKDELTIVTDENKNKGGFMRIGANLLAGVDCYITPHLYLGTELGFGFAMVNYKDYKMSTDYPSTVVVQSPDPGNPAPVTQGKEMNVGPNFNSSIRLGYIF